MTFKLPQLEYNFEALEPYIDAQTMQIHYNKHHQTYINNLNNVLEKHQFSIPNNIINLIKNIKNLPIKIQKQVRNNGGGHFNHSLFWKILTKDHGQEPIGDIKTLIDKEFISFENFKKEFIHSALQRFGSGWIWLCTQNKDKSKLFICSTANQDNPLMENCCDMAGDPILGLDVWEHAYYLKYQNRRLEYIEAFLNIINWHQVEKNFQEIK